MSEVSPAKGEALVAICRYGTGSLRNHYLFAGDNISSARRYNGRNETTAFLGLD